jgi:hypothetical protein
MICFLGADELGKDYAKSIPIKNFEVFCLKRRLQRQKIVILLTKFVISGQETGRQFQKKGVKWMAGNVRICRGRKRSVNINSGRQKCLKDQPKS